MWIAGIGLSVCVERDEHAKGDIMSSQVIVILVLVALAAVGLVWLEMHSRRNKGKTEEQATDKVETATQGAANTNRR
jgi:flagellar basal body-associated protein FliL